VVGGVRSGALKTSDIDEELLTNCMYTNQSPDPEIIIRTSGETRFSDFLLWQAQYTKIYVEKVLWPEFNIWNFYKIIFLYQRTCDETQEGKLKTVATQSNIRKTQFLKYMEEMRLRRLTEYTY